MIDEPLFFLINGVAGKYFWLDFLGILFAQYVPYLLAGVLVCFLIWNFRKNWKMVFISTISALFSRFFLFEIVRLFHNRTRPFLNPEIHKLLGYPALRAFPSGHASFFFAISTVLFFYNKKISIIFFVASFLMGIARIYTGLHWPLDILAGMIVGVLSGLFVYRMVKAVKV